MRFVACLALVLLLASTSEGFGQVSAPPGACVAIPRPTFHVHRVRRQSSPPDPAYPYEHEDTVGFGTSDGPDVDGDGTADVFVPEPAAGDCTSTMHVAIYLTISQPGGSCGHRLGVIEGRAVLASGRSHGLFDLETASEETIQDDPRVPAARRTHHRRYCFDGTTYREVAHTTTDAVCHHCSLESCTTTLVP